MSDYSKQGPCCDEYYALRAMYLSRIKIITALLDGNPRSIVMFAEATRKNIGEGSYNAMVEVGSGERCPCNETPNPELYRAFYHDLKRLGRMDESSILDLEKQVNDFEARRTESQKEGGTKALQDFNF